MKRGYCEGGPLRGQIKSVLHGAAFVDALTSARYEWCEDRWVHTDAARESDDCPKCGLPKNQHPVVCDDWICASALPAKTKP